jgi:hypothetical protein
VEEAQLMKREFGLLLVSLLVLSFCHAGFSAEQAPTKSSPASTAQKSQPLSAKKTTKLLKYRGKVFAMDSRSGTVSVSGAAGEKHFVVQDAAKDAMERLAVGDSVRVAYTDKNGKLAASSVRRVKATKASMRQTTTKKSGLVEPTKAAK